MATAIETKYAGCRFRSRLEARWAVFFDSLGIRWEYEPQGFEWEHYEDTREKPTTVRYLPDFFLPDTKAWVECKPWRDGISKEDCNKLWHAQEGGGILTRNSAGTNEGIILLDNPPNPVERGGLILNWPLFPFFQHYKGQVMAAATFGKSGPVHVCEVANDGGRQVSEYVDDFKRVEQSIDVRAFLDVRRDLGDHYSLIKAYSDARSARFGVGGRG